MFEDFTPTWTFFLMALLCTSWINYPTNFIQRRYEPLLTRVLEIFIRFKAPSSLEGKNPSPRADHSL